MGGTLLDLKRLETLQKKMGQESKSFNGSQTPKPPVKFFSV